MNQVHISEFYGKPIKIIEKWNTAMVFECEGKVYAECENYVYESRHDDL